MKFQILLGALIFGLVCLTACTKPNVEKTSQTPSISPMPSVENPENSLNNQTKSGCLLRAYPDFLQSVENNVVIWKDATQMIFDDGIEKTDYETKLNTADLQDQMADCYPLSDDYLKKLKVNYDPGRARNEAFFFKMYGGSAAEVEQKLVSIVWMPKNINKTIRVTSINGVDKKFKQISDELDNLPPEFMKYLQNPAGTFNWRVIAGTTRQSTHSFGTTIDINVALSNYWRDAVPDANGVYQYQNQIPPEIARIFEKYGFIWGGKWYHYDTMHFEYRPELLDSQCVCRD